MQSELFSELERKLESLIEEVETLRLEVSDLRAIRKTLEGEQVQVESNLKRMLGKFDQLQESADL